MGTSNQSTHLFYGEGPTVGVALHITFTTPQPLIVVPDFATVGNAYCGTFHIKEVG